MWKSKNQLAAVAVGVAFATVLLFEQDFSLILSLLKVSKRSMRGLPK